MSLPLISDQTRIDWAIPWKALCSWAVSWNHRKIKTTDSMKFHTLLHSRSSVGRQVPPLICGDESCSYENLFMLSENHCVTSDAAVQTST